MFTNWESTELTQKKRERERKNEEEEEREIIFMLLKLIRNNKKFPNCNYKLFLKGFD